MNTNPQEIASKLDLLDKYNYTSFDKSLRKYVTNDVVNLVIERYPDISLLDLADCAISDLSFLIKLKSLKRLYINRCPGVSDLRPIFLLKSLVFISITGCENIDEHQIYSLARNSLKLIVWTDNGRYNID